MENKKKTKAQPAKSAAKKKLSKKTDPDIQKLAQRIREIRKKLGYTNADFFAYDNEITRSQYARYEMGEDLRYTSLLRLIRSFGLSASEFFEGIE